MATKDRRKLQHIHSSIADKQPTPQSLEVGEIAVNNSANKEFLSLKNSNDKVVRFSSDSTIIDWIENKEVVPYSGVVDNVHLDTNRSNIEIKINQVAAKNTPKYNLINGAVDIDGNLVNPSTDGGKTDGAGFAIDMSRYAMIGANPSFSSLTVTDKTGLSGNTTIADGDGTSTRSGHTLTIKTTDVSATDTNWTENITNKTEKITLRDTTIGTEKLHVSGTTIETYEGAVTITNNNNKVETISGINTINNEDNYIVNTSGDTHIITTRNTAIHSNNRLGISANEELLVSSEDNIIITANDEICETAGNKVSFYGVNQTNIGLNCDDNDASTITKINGDTINEGGTTNNNNFTTINNTATTINNKANFNITGTTYIIGNTTISGDTTIGGKLYLKPDCTSITSTTVNAGLCEILDRSAITIEKNTEPSDTRLATVYTIKQNGSAINTIEVAKDKALKSASVVQDTSGEWVIRLVWYTFDPDSKTESETITDIPAKELVKDLEEANPADNGTAANHNVALSVWYDATSGNNKISAETTPNMHVTNMYASNTVSGATVSCTTVKGATVSAGTLTVTSNTTLAATSASSISATSVTSPSISGTAVSAATFYGPMSKKLTWTAGSFIPDSVGYNGSEDKVITVPTDVSHLTSGNLTVTHNGLTDTFDLANDKSMILPHSALTWSYGSVKGNTSSDSYDTSAEKSITIPTKVQHLDEWDGSCLVLPGCVQASGFYQSSDINLKENIASADFSKQVDANNIAIEQFNYKSDESKRTVYGVIAQDVEQLGLEELVYTNDEGFKSVDYTSLMLLKIAYLENENKRLNHKLDLLTERLDKIENKE